MKKLLLVGCIGIAAVAAVSWTTQAVAAEVSFKLVSMLPKKTPIGQAFGGFITRLNKELAGEFRIDWRGGPEVVPQFKQPIRTNARAFALIGGLEYLSRCFAKTNASTHGGTNHEKIIDHRARRLRRRPTPVQIRPPPRRISRAHTQRTLLGSIASPGPNHQARQQLPTHAPHTRRSIRAPCWAEVVRARRHQALGARLTGT